VKAAVITVSDRGAAGLREDASGPLLVSLLAGAGAEVVLTDLVPDEPERIREAFRQASAAVGRGLVISTGGTGLSPRDVTPESVEPLLSSAFPGIMEAIRREGCAKTPMAVLSRGVAGRIGDARAVTLPGSSKAVREGWEVLAPMVRGMLDAGMLA
jgi:molybdenum cofactor synthesis domain-containing protein